MLHGMGIFIYLHFPLNEKGVDVVAGSSCHANVSDHPAPFNAAKVTSKARCTEMLDVKDLTKMTPSRSSRTNSRISTSDLIEPGVMTSTAGSAACRAVTVGSFLFIVSRARNLSTPRSNVERVLPSSTISLMRESSMNCGVLLKAPLSSLNDSLTHRFDR